MDETRAHLRQSYPSGPEKVTFRKTYDWPLKIGAPSPTSPYRHLPPRKVEPRPWSSSLGLEPWDPCKLPYGKPQGERWLPSWFPGEEPPPPPAVDESLFPGTERVQEGRFHVKKHPDPLRDTGVPTGNCLICNKRPIMYAADPSMHAFACKVCARKMATGGRVPVGNREHFFELRDVSRHFQQQNTQNTRNFVPFQKAGDKPPMGLFEGEDGSPKNRRGPAQGGYQNPRASFLGTAAPTWQARDHGGR